MAEYAFPFADPTSDRSPAFPFSPITDADRQLEQVLKEHLDELAYPVQFFRDYDEPNEGFAPRLVAAHPALAARVNALPIWPTNTSASHAYGAF